MNRYASFFKGYCFKNTILDAYSVVALGRNVKFDVLEPRRCEDKTGIVAPDRGPKCFGTFEKQAPE